MLEIPLSEGSKLELHCTSQSFCLFQISVYFPVHSHICPRMYMYIAVYIYTRILAVHCIYNVHAEGFAL